MPKISFLCGLEVPQGVSWVGGPSHYVETPTRVELGCDNWLFFTDVTEVSFQLNAILVLLHNIAYIGCTAFWNSKSLKLVFQHDWNIMGIGHDNNHKLNPHLTWTECIKAKVCNYWHPTLQIHLSWLRSISPSPWKVTQLAESEFGKTQPRIVCLLLLYLFWHFRSEKIVFPERYFECKVLLKV